MNIIHLDGLVAQSVEQRTENPCVAGSIPVQATSLKTRTDLKSVSFYFKKYSPLVLFKKHTYSDRIAIIFFKDKRISF